MNSVRHLVAGKDNVCCFKYRNHCYVFDRYNCLYMEISETLYDCIRIIKSETYDLLMQGVSLYKEEVDFLYAARENGILFIDNLLKEQQAECATLSLTPVHKCNFKCSYCFARAGETYDEEKKTFNEKDIDRTLEFFYNHLFPDMERYRIEFVSGGEPLLCMSSIKRVIEYSEEFHKNSGKKVQIWLCTNGSLLTKEIVNYLDKHNVSIGISIDGEEYYHNANRVYPDGRGTYKDVINGLNIILEDNNVSGKMKNVWGLSVVSEYNQDLISIVKHYKKIGIKAAQLKVEWKSYSDKKEKEYHYNQLKRAYEEFGDFLLYEFQMKNIDYLIMIMNDNDQFGKILKSFISGTYLSRRCEAGRYKVTVCPNGDVYPCYGFIGNMEMKLGNILEGKFSNTKFLGLGVEYSPKCHKCDIKNLCGGDCYYNCFITTGNLDNPDDVFCEFQKFLCQLGIWLICEMRKTNNCLFERLEREVIFCENFRKK